MTGKPVWTNLQLDEVALPIVLAQLTGRTDAATYAHVKKSADFLATYKDKDTGLAAPYSPQERWENQGGYSPNSIAAQINGLVCAAAIARANGDTASSTRWLALADEWASKVQGWTVTTNGPLSSQPYFLRLTKDGNPNAGTTYGVGDGGPAARGPAVDRRRELPRPRAVRHRVAEGPGRDVLAAGHRQGAQGEHAERAVLAPLLLRRVRRDAHRRRVADHRPGHGYDAGARVAAACRGAWRVHRHRRRLRDAATSERWRAATGQADMLAEQVWDNRPPTGKACCPAGEGTRSATPLTWSHAGLVRLAWTIQRGTPVDQQAVVADRY